MKRKLKEPPIRERFEEAARLRRRNPEKILTAFMEECLERWADEKLDEQIGEQARRSGLREADAVRVVRQVRQAKRRRGGAA